MAMTFQMRTFSSVYIGRELCLYYHADIHFRASLGERSLSKVAKTRGATEFDSDEAEPFSEIEDDSPDEEERGRNKIKKVSVLFLVLMLFVLILAPVTLRRLTPAKLTKRLLARLRKQLLSVLCPKARILISRTMSPGPCPFVALLLPILTCISREANSPPVMTNPM
jgi:hypothetical protein